MPIFRTHKNKNFTVVDLDILKNKNLSYGAKGLLITCLSLPEDWEFSVRGLAALSSNKVTATENLLTELRDNGYLQIAQTRINGRFDYVYSFYEKPVTVGDFTDTEKPIRKNRYGKTDTENHPLYSINNQELKDKELKNKDVNITNTCEPCPYEKIVEIFSQVCISLPQIKTLSDKRKKALKSLYAQFSLADIQTVFEKAEQSDFLTGRSGGWNGCSFDWLINKNNFIKALEGNYDNKANHSNKGMTQIERLLKS